MHCPKCNTHYAYSATGALDLRLPRPKTYSAEFLLGTPIEPDLEFKPLRRHPQPQVDFADLPVPHHLTRDLLSHFPKASQPNSLALDLGCGRAIHRAVIERAGYKYVGVDYQVDRAPALADAHALPFQADSFDFILSIAVLEHIRFPFVMIRETYRVLKPHGVFIGTVAFLEPFHGDSLYHHSHLGVYNTLHYAGFHVHTIAPSESWSGIRAQASMGLFPYMPRALSSLLTLPLEAAHKMWWSLGTTIRRKDDRRSRSRDFTGAFTFIVSK